MAIASTALPWVWRRSCSLIANGVHSKVVSERLGHHWFTFTVETYQHVLPGMGEDAARVFEALLAPPATPDTNAVRNAG